MVLFTGPEKQTLILGYVVARISRDTSDLKINLRAAYK